MFQALTDRFSHALRHVMGTARLTEENIAGMLSEIEKALSEADVSVETVEYFLRTVREAALGQEVSKHLKPDQQLVKIVHDELANVMGKAHVELDLKGASPVVILLAGLQGSGKTTTAAKLAKRIQEEKKGKVLLTSCDVYRPAAIDQLRILSEEIKADFYVPESSNPLEIAKAALEKAKTERDAILIVDTAGRMHVDNIMMQEIKSLEHLLKPREILFVVDSMTGQDAVRTARAFNDALPLTGVVLTKLDGDARGGAALSIRHVTGKPIKFIGRGEKVDALEPFHPERIASRILGMGDVLSLIEEVERKADQKEAERLAKKLQAKHEFDFEDLRSQLKQMLTMGGIGGFMDKLPGMGQFSEMAKQKMDNKVLMKKIALIDSMTKKERQFPNLLQTSGSRKRRVTTGSGTTVQDLMKLLKELEQMKKMMKKFGNPGSMKQMLRGLQGKLPPGMFPGG